MAETVLAKMAVEISANAANFSKGINEVNAKFKGLTDSVNGVSKLLTTFGVGFGAGALLSGARAITDIMIDFERTMSEVRAITGATGKEFEALQKNALKLGAATKFSATEVGQLQVAFGRLGFNTDEILDATQATLDLAAATGEDLAKAADVAGSTVRGFGLEASETQRIVDVMAASFNQTALGLDNFTESMKYVAPIAAAANVSVEETTALLGVLADAGIRGSTAGTALRKIFSDLSSDARPVTERLDELGKKGITLTDAFDEVGRTAQTALLVLSKNREKADQLTTSFQNVDGAAAAMAKTMSDNLAGDLDQLSGAFEGLVLSGNGLLQPLRDVVVAVTNVLNAFTGLSNSTGQIGKFFKFLTDQLILPIKLLGLLAKAAGDTAGPIAENAEKLKAIANTVDAAFDSGNIEAYIKALDQNIYKEEIIAEIRKRQADEAVKAGQVEIETLNKVSKARDKSKKEVEFTPNSVNAYRKALQELNKELDNTNAKDTSRVRIISAQIAGYEEAIKRVSALKDSFNELTFVIKPPDTSALFEGIDMEPIIKRFDNSMAKIVEVAKARTDEMNTMFLDFGGIVGSVAAGVGEALGNAIGGGENFGRALLGVLGKVLVQLGEMLIAAGLGVEGFKTALKSLNGYVAIAAGAALIAIGTAVGASIKNLGRGAGGGGATGSVGGGSSSSSNLEKFSRTPSEQVILVGGEIKWNGNTLALALDRAYKSKERTG